MKRFLRAQEKGRLKDISEFVINEDVVDNLFYFDCFFYNFSSINDDIDMDDKYPGFKEIYDIFKIFFSKIKIKDSDSDIDSDSEVNNLLKFLNDQNHDCEYDSDDCDYDYDYDCEYDSDDCDYDYDYDYDSDNSDYEDGF